MKTSTSVNHQHHAAFNHYLTIDALLHRMKDPATRTEADAELLRYRDQGLIIQSQPKEAPMVKGKPVYSGRGIIFAVIDDREGMRTGRVSTVDVIADAIEAALDDGQETSEEIARYITTSAFQHMPDKRVRFNSVLKASDTVGAQVLRKLYNAYNELAEMAEGDDDPQTKRDILNEALGFAEALNVVLSPFSCEYPGDPRLVNWDEVDRITENFIKEQRQVRRERKGNPQ